MANTDKRNLGPNEVEQDKNAHEIFDETDDIREYQPSQTSLEAKKEDLDRGEELYTGFGFDSDRPAGDDPLAESIRQTDTTTHNPSISQVPQPPYAKERYAPQSSAAPKIEEKSIKRPAAPTTNLGYKTTTKSEKREVPEQTKLIIEPENGDFSYKKRQADPRHKRIVEDTLKPSSRRQVVDHKSYRQNQYENAEGTLYTEANYESQSIHYSTDPRTLVDPYYNELYIPVQGTIDYLPIKHHYKSKRKQNKKSLPWTKIALGVAVAAGVRLLFLGEEDDGPFWT